MVTPSKPIVIIPADSRQIGAHPFQAVGEKYINAVERGALCVPLLLPSLRDGLDIDALLESVDGVFLTGSPSNVAPHHYGQVIATPELADKLDEKRDATTLPLIRAAIAKAVPILAVCRGFQEMNVAFGGTLFQRVHNEPGKLDHREDKTQPLAQQYGPSHEVAIVSGGLLHKIGGVESATVNSLHGQGVDRLADNLHIEATAPDGLVEAFSVQSAPGFALGVQWHPEWRVEENPVSLTIFRAFGEACESRRRQRNKVP